MKQATLILFFAMFIAKNSFSQWTVSGTNIFNNNIGFVGVSNSTPGTSLDIGNVTKSTFAAVNTDILGLQVRSSSSQTSAFKLGSFFYNSQTVANTAGISALNGYVLSSNASGTVGVMNSIQGTTEHNGSGTITWDRPFFASGLLTGSGIITNWASFYGGGVTITSSSTITNGYGLYLAAFPGGVTNKYGVYAVDANAMNYFAGNVGIGTTNSGSFKLAVEGKIGAREIQVLSTIPFPDFVFEKNYNLMNIDSLKNFINVNKHLPNMPSAAEIKENGGIELGSLSEKLLQKVEELTLYIIDLKKENEEMKIELRQLSSK